MDRFDGVRRAFPRNRPRQTERNEVRNGAYEERGMSVGRRLVGRLATPRPGDVSPLGIPRTLGRCRFYELPWNRVTSTRTPAARRVPSHRRTSECTCSIPTHRHGRHDVHAGPITTDTDTGPSRTYEEETRNEYERAYALHHVADAYSSFFISYRRPFVRERIFHEKTYMEYI